MSIEHVDASGTSTPPDTMRPVGTYSHVAKAGELIVVSGTAGVDPRTGELAGTDVATQTLGKFVEIPRLPVHP